MPGKKALVDRLVAVGSVLVMCMGLAVSGVAQAASVTFHFAGTVSAPVNPILNPPILPNSPISGTYTFEPTTPDLLGGSPLIARYALSDFSLDVLGRHYTMNPSSGIQVIHVQLGEPVGQVTTDDEYSVHLIPENGVGAPAAVLGPSINNLAPQGFQLRIFGSDLFTSDALPRVPPSLGNIASDRRTFNMTFQAGGFTGELTSLTVAPVPLPGALLLFGSGLLGLAGLGVHRRLRKS